MRGLPKPTMVTLLAGLLLAGVVLTLNLTAARVAPEKPTVEWARTYGGSDYDWALSVVQTFDGGFALAGTTESYGAGGRDFWLVKTDSSGNLQWERTYGGSGHDTAESVVQTSDGGFALAGCTGSYGADLSDFWLVKTDSLGEVEWERTYGGSDYDGASSVVQTSDGGFALAGYTESYGAGSSDFWLVKTDSSGEVEWSENYGGYYNDWTNSVVQTSDGGFALAGGTESYGAGRDDFWLVKTDSSGNLQWDRTYGGYYNDWTNSVVQTSDGGLALAGETKSYGAGYGDFWLVKTDSSGNLQWERAYGGSDFDWAGSVVQTSDGGLALAGETESYGAGGRDFWLVKTDSSGEVEWSENYGGSDDDGAWSVVQTSDGGFALAGTTESYGAGDDDFWLVKISGKVPVQYTLTTSVNPSEGGSITLDPLGGTYKKGTKVKVTAEPAEGYEFNYWSGDYPEGEKNSKQVTVTMELDKDLKAHFGKEGPKPVPPSPKPAPPWTFIGIIMAIICIIMAIAILVAVTVYLPKKR